MNVVPVRYASLLEWRCIEWALCWSGTPACWTGGVLRGLCVVRYASLLDWRCTERALCWSGMPACWTGGVLSGLCVGQVRQPAGSGQAAVY